MGGTERSQLANQSFSHQPNPSISIPAGSALPLGELSQVNDSILYEQQVFKRRLHFINKRLDEEVRPEKLKSRNKNDKTSSIQGLFEVNGNKLRLSSEGSEEMRDSLENMRKYKKSLDQRNSVDATIM